jgi:hypothetical protein
MKKQCIDISKVAIKCDTIEQSMYVQRHYCKSGVTEPTEYCLKISPYCYPDPKGFWYNWTAQELRGLTLIDFGTWFAEVIGYES